MRIAIVSGGFSPIHGGHVEYMERASRKCMSQNPKVICILNNKNWLVKKKGYEFLPEIDRKKIIEAFWFRPKVILSSHEKDCVDISVNKELRLIREMYPADELFFCKGGDRFENEIPESKTCAELGITIIDGLGEKINSSSELVRRAREYIT